MAPQEMTPAGDYVRHIDAGSCEAVGIAASGDMIAVSVQKGRSRALLFDIVTGELLRAVSVAQGRRVSDGQLWYSVGLRFTPDGHHLLIAEYNGNRLHLFTLTGQLVREVGLAIVNSPWDVGFASNGDILVCDRGSHRITVFTPDGSSLVTTFGTCGHKAAGQFKRPAALATHANTLYVLDEGSARVQVFN